MKHPSNANIFLAELHTIASDSEASQNYANIALAELQTTYSATT